MCNISQHIPDPNLRLIVNKIKTRQHIPDPNLRLIANTR